MTTQRRTIVREYKAIDEVRPTDIATLLDYLESIAGTSDAAARATALDIKDIHQISSRDMGNLYDYVNLLGTPTLTKTEFLNRRMRDRDFTSRRHLDHIMDVIEGAFGGLYSATVLADFVGEAEGNYLSLDDGVTSPLTDDGPDGSTSFTPNGSPVMVADQPWAGANSVNPDSDYDAGNLPGLMEASSSFSLEGWFQPATQTGAGTFFTMETLESPTGIIVGTDDNEAPEFSTGLDVAQLADPGAWAVDTLYAQGDRVRLIADTGARAHEAEVGGTSHASVEPTFDTGGGTVTDGANTAGTQAVDYGASITGGGATGLANDATVYTGTVTIDGGSSQPISVVGSTAQDFDALIVQLDLDTTGGAWTIVGGDLVCTSTATGDTSSVLITDVDVFSTTPAFVAILAAVQGLNEITWRDLGTRASFHNVVDLGTTFAFVVDQWYYVVFSREDNGDFVLYIDNVEVLRTAVAADDTTPGSFGSPKPYEHTVALGPVTGQTVDFGQTGGADDWEGQMSNLAIYHFALTAAQRANHLDAGQQQIAGEQ